MRRLVDFCSLAIGQACLRLGRLSWAVTIYYETKGLAAHL